jgi:hypothetical protein
MIFFIKLHMSLRNFVAIGFNIKERSFFLCLLSLLPRSHGAASWHVRSQKSVTPFDKSFYPPMYHELAHASASWFVHGYHDGWDIAAVVTATPAVQTPAIRLLQSRFPANRWSSMTFCHSILHTLPSNPTKWIAFWFYDNHATAHHNHRCPPTCMSWMHRCFTTFLAKPLHESPSPLARLCVS